MRDESARTASEHNIINQVEFLNDADFAQAKSAGELQNLLSFATGGKYRYMLYGKCTF